MDNKRGSKEEYGAQVSVARSFLPKTFTAFIEHLEQTMTHPVRPVFWYGQESYCDLTCRPGWEMETQGRSGRVFDIKDKYGYSIWSFDPGKRQTDNAHEQRDTVLKISAPSA